MTRDDLYDHYKRFYIPNNATLVIVGDVDSDAALRQTERHFGKIPAGTVPPRLKTQEPEQTGERRVVVRKEGTTAYLKVAFHAPSISDRAFYPLLLLDAVMTGANGLNLWASFRVPPPQRSARLYRALVERGLASAIAGSVMPTEQPFVYVISITVASGTPIPAAEAVLCEELDRVAHDGITSAELARAKAQLTARLVFENDSITNIAHQIGYFETIAHAGVIDEVRPAIASVRVEDVADAARAVFAAANRTTGWFEPQAPA
jgi:zinc protease